MQVYHFDPSSGEYLGTGSADPHPVRYGAFLLPAHSTAEPPPEAGADEAAVYRGGAWSLVPDHRGRDYWHFGKHHRIEALGEEPPRGASDEPPPPSLDDAKAAKRREIDRAHRQAVTAALGATPHAPGLAGDAAYIDARLAAEGGQDRAALVQRLKAEADAARSAAGAADGKRAARLAALDAAEDLAAVEAVAW